MDLMDLLLHDHKKFWGTHLMIENKKPSFYSKEFKELMDMMTDEDPHKRATLKDIELSKWYNKEVYSEDELKKVMKKYLNERYDKENMIFEDEVIEDEKAKSGN
mmetsp:Transcript_41388/g.36748  ORF Transcript_41388/g.36748 Transcript_41388/m.36748 type:complete len:104 (+) Transcript_41388:838-1149(+)|eukprot:CAMPEP_0114587636 /NCGR_PEP_ID=MMETSP0125-20121206/10554_1 /TAXON_ID=485358 ORGANISM="Aristerostoma sp., Strain ATCC 50986" /NCGR_SAMPLE_ID=MMETSP0125 /ASSEMBLY_ACC=CAM_ASM_000245 /LENGTH=103 /DNA_ID=CAMNT_0001783661 /DNA_START=821 /DNA_END=1132 /DNA_ORIENTATION=+